MPELHTRLKQKFNRTNHGLLHGLLPIYDHSSEPDEDEARYLQAVMEHAPESEGQADGAFGEQPKYPEDHRYWEGYSRGLREYWLGKLNRIIPIDLEHF